MSAMGRVSVDPDFKPQTEADWAMCLQDPMWRICSGQLYKIMIKGDADTVGHVQPFRPNINQRAFLSALHYLNVILKARQLGFTTLISIIWLDHALFNADQRCGLIAHTLEDAASIFRDKVKFAYENLPAPIRSKFPLKRDSGKELLFAHNNSAIRVATSMRSGTIHRLHISEMGKIAAARPDRAKEITTGSLPTVPANGIVIIESTAEGMAGEFYDIATRAEKRAIQERALKDPILPTDYRFHFFAWWQQPEYRLPLDQAKRVRISAKEHEYFDTVEGLMDCEIHITQRAWYIAKRDNSFATTPEDMWREFPSTPKECWQASTDGKYYATALAIARREGRIGKVPLLRHVPVNSFWDLGASDDTSIWLHQRVGRVDHWVRFYEAAGAGYLHFILWLESQGCIWGTHYLPHDADQKRQQNQKEPSEFAIASPVMILREMRPSWDFQVVPRVQTIQHGIDLVRQDFSTYWFDEEGCKEGLAHIEAYSREWNTRLQCWHDHPRHDEHSHAADALRQKAQGYSAGTPLTASNRTANTGRAPRRRASGMTA
jgi:hypothetical protein